MLSTSVALLAFIRLSLHAWTSVSLAWKELWTWKTQRYHYKSLGTVSKNRFFGQQMKEVLCYLVSVCLYHSLELPVAWDMVVTDVAVGRMWECGGSTLWSSCIPQRPVQLLSIFLSRGLIKWCDGMMYEHWDNEVLSGWKAVPDSIYLFKKTQVTTKTPFPILHCLFWIGLGGGHVFLNCLLCLNTFFVVQVLFCVLGPNSCQ